MGFEGYHRDAWNRHGNAPQEVFEELPAGRDLAETGKHLAAWGALVAHVAGEHLGRWSEGIALLDTIAADERFAEAEAARRSLHRSRAALLIGAGDRAGADAVVAENLDDAWPEASSQIRVWTTATTALAMQGEIDKATALFQEALKASAYGPDAKDPASRALAISGNNLAMDLEDLSGRSPAQDALMILAARTSRTWWAVAGDATNVLLADVRVASSLLAAGNASDALPFAEAASRGSEAEGTLAGYRIQAMLVLGKARQGVGDAQGAAAAVAKADEAFTHLPEAYRAYYESQIEALRADLMGG
ncbi:MAG: hypothetical protein AAGA48_19140 [Myxococcota bacterium]